MCRLKTTRQQYIFDLLWQGKDAWEISKLIRAKDDRISRRSISLRIKNIGQSLGVDVWTIAHQEKVFFIRDYFSRWEKEEISKRAEKIRDYFRSEQFRRSQLADLAIELSQQTKSDYQQALKDLAWLEERSLLRV
jgi:hypothetical protein